MTDSVMSLDRGSRLGPYEILALLGRGGMGEVYRARDPRLGRDVAVKVVQPRLASDPERLSRFEKEARAAARLDHPNILVVHDVGTHDGTPFIVSELLEGETLRERLRMGALPVRQAVETALQLALGLAAAHEKGIVHRDLKPANVFITKDGRVKILDFGLSKLVASMEASDVDTETLPGTLVGTVPYMSPEQLSGQRSDARSDLFSMGIVLYEMLSGRHPFQHESVADTMSAILHEEPPDLTEANRGIPAALEKIVRHCLEKNPANRFQSARDVVFAIEGLPDVSSASPATPMTAPGVWIHRHRTSLVGTSVLAITLVVAGYFGFRKHSAVPPSPSVLALPCAVYGAPESAFLTDAVPGTISTFLSQVEGLDMKVPPNSFEVEKVKGDLTKLAELYEVSSFIVTSITPSPGRFTLNVELVDAATRKVKWGKQYEGSRETYNELVRQAAEGIRLAVRPTASPVPTTGVSSEVELALREGDYFQNRYRNLRHARDFDAGLSAYQRALKEDPSVAIAAAQTSRMYILRFQTEGPSSGALKDCNAWALRALEIDRRCGRAWAELAWLDMFSTKPDIERQLEYSLKAASLSPRDAISHLTVANSVQNPGAFSLLLAASLAAKDVDPFYLPGSANSVFALSSLGRPEKALPIADRAMSVEPEAWENYFKGYALLKLGRLEEARKTLAHWEPQFFENPGTILNQMWGQIRFELAGAERDTAMIEKLEPLIVPPLLGGRADALTLSNGTVFVCPALALLGRHDESIRILLRSVDAGIPPPYDYLLYEPAFKSLRSDPRFAKVVTASRDGAARIARILERARSRGELPKYLEAPLGDLHKLLNEKGAGS